jgi:peptidoglycan/xylan/chitin deacetylase (PgdA/CDA1 family)
VRNLLANLAAMAARPYYSSLRPFRELFRTGRPVLTYHHVGRRPRDARLKGLYVSGKLFARQMKELEEQGFSAPDYDSVTQRRVNSQRQVFLTFDDGFRDVFINALPVLKKHHFRAIQFLVADFLGKTSAWQAHSGGESEQLMDDAEVKDWLATGQQIGSHTRTHPWLTHVAPAVVCEEIFGSKKALEDRFGVAVEHFCYPYGDWNEAVRDLVIAAGYKTACTTKAGVNTPSDSPFSLKRFTARYPSRNLKAIWAQIRGWNSRTKA